MVIRPATMADLPGVYDLVREMHERSKYFPDVGIDSQTVRSLVMQSVQRHGGKNNGSTHFVVSDEGGELTGFMLGALQRVYLIGDRLEAQDVYLYVREGASPRAAFGLINSYLDWAESCPKVATVKLAYTDAINADEKRIGGLYERKGFKIIGAMYERMTA